MNFVKKQGKKIAFITFFLFNSLPILAMNLQEQKVWIRTHDEKLMTFKAHHISDLGTMRDYFKGYVTSANNPLEIKEVSSKSVKLIKKMLNKVAVLGNVPEKEKVEFIIAYITEKKIDVSDELKQAATFLDCVLLTRAFESSYSVARGDQEYEDDVKALFEDEINLVERGGKRKRQEGDNNLVIRALDDTEIYIPKQVVKKAKMLKDISKDTDNKDKNNELVVPASAMDLQRAVEILEMANLFDKKLHNIQEIIKKYIQNKDWPLEELLSLAHSVDFLGNEDLLYACIPLVQEKLIKRYNEGTADFEQLSVTHTIACLLAEKIRKEIESNFFQELTVLPTTLPFQGDICEVFGDIIVINKYRPILFNLKTKEEIRLEVEENFAQRFSYFSYAPNKQTVAAVSEKKDYLALWNAYTGRLIAVLHPLPDYHLGSFSFSNYDNSLVVVHTHISENTNIVSRYDIDSKQWLIIYSFDIEMCKLYDVNQTSILRDALDEGFILVNRNNSSFSGKATYFKAFTEVFSYPAIEITHTAGNLIFCHNYPVLAFYNDTNKSIELLDVTEDTILKQIAIHTTFNGKVTAIALSPDKTKVALLLINSESIPNNSNIVQKKEKGKIIIFDLPTSSCINEFDFSFDITLEGAEPSKSHWPLYKIFFSPDSKSIFVFPLCANIVTGSFSLNLETGTNNDIFVKNKITTFTSLHFLSNGSIIVSDYQSRFVKILRDVDTNALKESLTQISLEQLLLVQSILAGQQRVLTEKTNLLYKDFPTVLKKYIKPYVQLPELVEKLN